MKPLEKTQKELLDHLLGGGKVEDTREWADALLMSLFDHRSGHYEIVVLGDEYCFRTKDREYEIQRVPATVGGVLLLASNYYTFVEVALNYYATGGKKGF
ncbi:hypothetical protein pEaSNUABM11_00158 [Erwinia phage pEa_SNUABM_11]|nr:hypothetical protein pEaSNUABM11_00158 [Erwinia phage pEa_SNUABM_11]